MAPMKDVTDIAFRALIAKRGKPDVFWTEFVAADGLYHTREIQKMPDESNPLMRDLQFDTKEERPIVAQIFSSKPEMIAYAVKLVAELGFDGVDINMGCPDRAIEKQGCGSAMIKNPELAREIIRAAKEASSASRRMPVSVKTRIGYNKESLDEWLPVLLEAAPAAITIHLRTRKQLSLVPADWELMKKVIDIRNKINPEVLIIGNGDVASVAEGKRLCEETGCDGVMIGRGMFGNPWIFEKISRLNLDKQHGLDEKLEALIELAHNFEKISPPKNFSILKKHIKAFVTGFSGAADLRTRLMEAENAAELEKAVRLYT
jgi:nifR3 family TIM-barrel protein